jgi:hypothetical protein
MTQNEVTTCVLKSSFQWKDVKGTQTYSVALNLASAAKVRAIQDMYLRPLCKMAEEIVTYEALQSPFKTKIRQSHWVSLFGFFGWRILGAGLSQATNHIHAAPISSPLQIARVAKGYYKRK